MTATIYMLMILVQEHASLSDHAEFIFKSNGKLIVSFYKENDTV